MAIYDALFCPQNFIMIYESVILMRYKTNHLQRAPRQSISHHVFDNGSELGHSLKLNALICKYTLADEQRRDTLSSYFDVWKNKAMVLRWINALPVLHLCEE